MYLINVLIVILLIVMQSSIKSLSQLIKDSRVNFFSITKINLSDWESNNAISLLVIFGVGLGLFSYTQKSNHGQVQIDMQQGVQDYYAQQIYTINIGTLAPSWGNDDAFATFVVVSDFQCPYCKIAALKLRTMLWEHRKVIRMYFINYPLDKTINPYTPYGEHQNAGLAACASICAENFGDFWTYHDDVFRNQNKLSLKLLLDLAQTRGWNIDEFRNCLFSQETYERIIDQIELAQKLNVEGTPTIFLNGRQLKYWHSHKINSVRHDFS